MIVDGAKPNEPEALILLAAHRGGVDVEYKHKSRKDAEWEKRHPSHVGTKFLPDNYYRAAPGDKDDN